MPKRAPPSRTDLIEQLYPLRLSPRPLLIRLLLRLFHPPLELLNLFLQSLLQYPLLSLSLVCEGECARGEIVFRVGESLARLCLGCDLGFGVPLESVAASRAARRELSSSLRTFSITRNLYCGTHSDRDSVEPIDASRSSSTATCLE